MRSFQQHHRHNDNTANGFSALFSNTTGSNNTANGSFNALFSNTTGNNNTANGLMRSCNQGNTTGEQQHGQRS